MVSLKTCLQLWDEHSVFSGAPLYNPSEASTSLFFVSVRIQRLNLLCLLSRVSVTHFTNPAIRYFQPYQFAKQCFPNNARLWHNGCKRTEREELGVRLPAWCGDVTWHLHLLDLRTAVAHAGWWMAVCVCRWSSCVQSAPANVVLLHENWDGFHLLYVHLFCDLEHMVPESAAF